MASATNSLRLCLRTCKRAPSFRPAPRAAPLYLRRPLSTTRPRWADGDRAEGSAGANEGKEGNELDPDLGRDYTNPGDVLRNFQNDDSLTPAEKVEAEKALSAWGRVPAEEQAKLQKLVSEVRGGLGRLRRPVKPRRNSFWHEEEEDSDLISSEVGEDDFEEDDILSMGHGKLEEHREFREYARLAVWEMPLLAQFAKTFEPPAQNEPLRFRYTTYMGEFHPAERKVVVEFSPRDMGLTDAQQVKLTKLAGARYNPEKEVIRIGCDMFDHQAQNKRYLGDLVQNLVTEAKDPKDTYEDIPLDTRHHEVKVKPKFPKEWRMTEERRKELEGIRRQSLLLDETKRAENTLIDGVQTIEKALEASAVQEKVAQLATVRAPVRSRLSTPGRR